MQFEDRGRGKGCDEVSVFPVSIGKMRRFLNVEFKSYELGVKMVWTWALFPSKKGLMVDPMRLSSIRCSVRWLYCFSNKLRMLEGMLLLGKCFDHHDR